ncbi:MAG TPA: hypothetical protein VNN73_10990 [Blastocatellia bacterium]|nr:hypothetical protein [Blastocatellia bacterium]
MKSRKVRFASLFTGMAFLLTAFAPFGTQHAMLPPDPEGESTVAYTMINTSGDPSGVVSAAYVLDDTSVVFNVELTFTTDQTATYRIDGNLDTNTYTITTLSSSTITPTDLPPIYGASIAVYTVKNESGKIQNGTIDVLRWRRTGSAVGWVCYRDGFETYPTSVTGGLTWQILRGAEDPPYTTNPYNTDVYNDAWGKYKNYDFGDPNLSTVAVHYIKLGHKNSDPDNVPTGAISVKLKNEGKRDFHFEYETNKHLCAVP